MYNIYWSMRMYIYICIICICIGTRVELTESIGKQNIYIPRNMNYAFLISSINTILIACTMKMAVSNGGKRRTNEGVRPSFERFISCFILCCH
jgi:hypothetical protein